MRCSPAGLAFTPYARSVLGLLAEGAAAAAGTSNPGRGMVRIAAVTTAAEQVLPDLLARFRAEHPRGTVRLQVTDSRAVWATFTTHGADVVLAGRPPASTDGAVTRGVRPNRLLAVAAPHIGDDLEGTPWLMRETGSGTRATLEALLEAQELRPPFLNMAAAAPSSPAPSPVWGWPWSPRTPCPPTYGRERFASSTSRSCR